MRDRDRLELIRQSLCKFIYYSCLELPIDVRIFLPDVIRPIIRCGDGVVLGNEECDDGNSDNEDGCSSSCRVEIGYTCTSTQPTICTLNCGNSMQESLEECDDGGLVASDGCSSTCTVEEGWECDGNFPTNCTRLCGNGRFDPGEVCDDGAEVNEDGCDSSCQIEAGWECSGFPSKCNLICSNGRVDQDEECDDGGLINGNGCSDKCKTETDWVCEGSPSKCKIKVRIESSEQAIGKSVQMSITLGVLAYLVVSTVLGTALAPMWAMINAMQLINYMGTFSLYFPKSIMSMLSFVNIANMENEYLASMYQAHLDSNLLHNRTSWDHRFENQGIESTHILQNGASIFAGIILMVCYYTIIALLCFCLGKHNKQVRHLSLLIIQESIKDLNCCRRVISKFRKRAHEIKSEILFNSAYKIFEELFIDLCFITLYHLKNIRWENWLDYYGNSVAFVWTLIILSVIMFLPFYYVLFPKIYSAESIAKFRLKVLINDYKENRKICMCNSILFIFRRAVMVWIVILGWNNGWKQVILFSLICFILIVFKIIVKPYKNTILNLQDILFEFIILGLSLTFMEFTNKSTELAKTGRPHLIGMIGFCLVIMLCVLNYVFTFTILVKHCRVKPLKKQKIKPKKKPFHKFSINFAREISSSQIAIKRNSSLHKNNEFIKRNHHNLSSFPYGKAWRTPKLTTENHSTPSPSPPLPLTSHPKP
ncbi:unnamed protein product [Moneuplotes crassus]|uniref:Uncharacterized protein n=1 Tax=Euplotes crassus TaxID=5936 RepID=A0AAD1XZD5_EUPCR|nr:unnamed protein product [Moneuplotes crassus]